MLLIEKPNTFDRLAATAQMCSLKPWNVGSISTPYHQSRCRVGTAHVISSRTILRFYVFAETLNVGSAHPTFSFWSQLFPRYPGQDLGAIDPMLVSHRKV
jgi:hypothetical protein